MSDELNGRISLDLRDLHKPQFFKNDHTFYGHWNTVNETIPQNLKGKSSGKECSTFLSFIRELVELFTLDILKC